MQPMGKSDGYYGPGLLDEFVRLLAAAIAEEGHIVNTSSITGFWASVGPRIPHIQPPIRGQGSTEALITDRRINSPHIKCSVVMPGQIGTSIRANRRKIHSGDRESDAVASSASPIAFRARIAARRIVLRRLCCSALRWPVHSCWPAPSQPVRTNKCLLDRSFEGSFRSPATPLRASPA
jgi:NAD(P)-dependent dehydrogenase (short-subunit alcohol dehydrogenase family)